MIIVSDVVQYHLLDFNCNSFTNDCIGFLTGGSIPSHIKGAISHRVIILFRLVFSLSISRFAFRLHVNSVRGCS
jgi:hypothetical protein